MIEFGKTLRQAREAKGYTISQLAEVTHIMNQTIEDLENENFTKIAAPIYGRGFVKLYCEAVGLDPKTMIFEFMEIFNGNRDLGIKERPVASAASSNAPVETQPTPAEPIAPIPPQQPALFTAPPEAADLNTQIESEQPSQSHLSRYASPLREASLPSIPPSFWRIAALAVVALLVLWLIGISVKALYNATSGSQPQEEALAEEKITVNETTPTNTKREKVEVPSLYVD
jgi:cytoskeletal protein RodZ